MPRLTKHEALIELELHNRALNLASGGCVLCAIVHERPNDVVFESIHAQLRLARFACTRAHLLVVAKAHVEQPHELGLDIYLEMQKLAYQCSDVLRQHFGALRVYIAALGSPKPLQMTFPHFHIHVVPVYTDDERARPANVFTWNNGVTTYGDAEARTLVCELQTKGGALHTHGSP